MRVPQAENPSLTFSLEHEYWMMIFGSADIYVALKKG